MCRAVVITGLPFAPSFDPKVKMKREFLDHNKAKQHMASIEDGGFGVKKSENTSLSGHEWYTQQAHRAVNQGELIYKNLRYHHFSFILNVSFYYLSDR
jgi:regulator of telomere elongation helicase 1